MSGIGYAKLAAQSDRRYAGMMVRNVHYLRIGHRAQQIANQAVELRVSNEMGRLLIAQTSTQNARETEQRHVAASQAVRSAIGTDQFALNAKCGGLQRKEMNILERGAVNRFAKHECVSLD